MSAQRYTKIPAQRYKIQVAESFIAFSHGITHTITEFFIPSKGICVNIGDENLNVIPQGDPRDGAKEIEDIYLPENLVRALDKWAKTRDILIREVKLLIG